MSTDTQKSTGILHWLDENFENIFLVSGLLAIIFFITWQVIYRYFITPLVERAGAAVWTEEISRYIFIWISYIAVSVAIRKRSSIRIDFVYQMLPPRLQRISWIFVELIFLMLTLTITYYGWGQIERLQRFPQHTAAMRIPFLIPYLILPLGFGLMSLRLVQSIVKQIKVTGILDSLIGAVVAVAVMSPCVLAEYIDPVPALFGYFLIFCVTGVPIAIGLGMSALTTILCADTLPIEYLAQVSFTSLDSFPTMAIPFFIAAGVFMGAGGLSQRLLGLADELVGGMYGGMALTTVATCMFFGAISGSGPATVAAIGALTIPAMEERGYSKTFAAAIVAAAGAIGVMIPPSNPFVVYGIAAQVSIGDLFIGGLHTAANGGTWIAAVQGFGGFKFDGEKIMLNPNLPDKWELRLSEDGVRWGDVVAHGEFGNILANPVEQFADFAKPLKIRYARLTATHAVKGEAAFNPAHKWAVMFYQ